MNQPDDVRALLHNERFPRSNGYEPAFMFETCMGPNVLWLTEWLSEALDLRAGMRVLDLGCGRAASSVFLAREFGVRVWATDLWIAAEENAARIAIAGVADLVTAVHAEAHALPFDASSFDAIVSIDAYHYFGTDDLYLGVMAELLAPGGQIGIAVPGARQELDGPPTHAAPYWDWAFCSFHSPEWWARHWEKTGLLHVRSADWLEDGWQHWARWNEVCARGNVPKPDVAAREAEMLRIDAGRTFGFSRVVAERMSS